MGDTSCIDLTAATTDVFASSSGKSEALELLRRDAPLEEYIDLLAGRVDSSLASAARAEFAELPATVVKNIVDAWALAEGAGKQFELRSVRPDAPLEFARAKRVRIQIDAEAEDKSAEERNRLLHKCAMDVDIHH